MGRCCSPPAAKDLRFALPNARVMIHQRRAGSKVRHRHHACTPRKSESEEADQRNYVKHTGQPIKKIGDRLERDYFLTAEAARTSA